MAENKLPKGKSKWQRFAVRSGIVLLSLLLFLLVIDKIVMPWYVKRGEVTVLPKVVGKPVDDAMRILSEAGYEPIKYETQFDEKAREGTIIRQTPEGGDETKPGRKVYLIVSGGKEMAVVPNLTGLPLKDARILLVRLNLDVGKTEMEFTDSIPGGTVFKQFPAAGERISTEQKVNIVVSEGQRAGRVPVPDLTHMLFKEAIITLGNAKLGVGNRSFQPSSTEKPGTVVDQSPKPGEMVLEGTTIDLFIVEEKVAEPANEN
ncbi:MAG: PASTA domain-containing protein [Candidatus Kapaibacterium sp.]